MCVCVWKESNSVCQQQEDTFLSTQKLYFSFRMWITMYIGWGVTHTHTHIGKAFWATWKERVPLGGEDGNVVWTNIWTKRIIIKKTKKQGRRSYSRRPPLFPVNTQWLPSRCFWVLVLQANFHVCVCVYCFSFSRWCLYRSSTNTLARDVCVCGKRQLRSSSRSNTCCIHLSIGYIR